MTANKKQHVTEGQVPLSYNKVSADDDEFVTLYVVSDRMSKEIE